MDKPGVGKKIGFTLLCGVIALAGVLFAPFTIVSFFLVPAPLVYCGVRYGWGYLLAAAVVAFVLPAALGMYWASLVLAALFLPAAAIMTAVLKKKQHTFEALVYMAGSYVIGILLVAAGFRLIAQTDVASAFSSAIGSLGQSYPDLARDLLVMLNSQEIMLGSVSMEAIYALPDADAAVRLVTAASDAAYSLVPGLAAYYCLGGSLASYAITATLLRRRGADINPMPPLRSWTLPKSATVGLILALAVGLLGELILPDMPNIALVCSMLINSVIIIAAAVGLAMVEFVLSRTQMRRGARTVILVIAALLLPTLLAIVGGVEQLFSMRKRMETPAK